MWTTDCVENGVGICDGAAVADFAVGAVLDPLPPDAAEAESCGREGVQVGDGVAKGAGSRGVVGLFFLFPFLFYTSVSFSGSGVLHFFSPGVLLCLACRCHRHHRHSVRLQNEKTRSAVYVALKGTDRLCIQRPVLATSTFLTPRFPFGGRDGEWSRICQTARSLAWR